MGLATADIHVKVDPEVKTGAEKVLKEIGITMSDLINMTLRRVVRERRVPFETAVSENLRIEDEEHLRRFLEERLEKDNGARYSIAEVKKKLNEQYGVRV